MSWIKRSQSNEMEPKWIQRRRVFGYNKALYVISNNEDHEFKLLKNIEKENICRYKETIPVKSISLCKAEFFGPVVRTLEDVKLIRYVWFFARKEN